jgi:hypothetical protein
MAERFILAGTISGPVDHACFSGGTGIPRQAQKIVQCKILTLTFYQYSHKITAYLARFSNCALPQ